MSARSTPIHRPSSVTPSLTSSSRRLANTVAFNELMKTARDLQREKEELQREKEQLAHEVERARSEKEKERHHKKRLLRERDNLAVKVMDIQRSAELTVPRAPEYWTSKVLDGLPLKMQWPEGRQALHHMLEQAAVHACCSGRDGTFVARTVRSVKVWWVENPMVWRQYCNKAAEMSSRHAAQGSKCAPVEPAVAGTNEDQDHLPERLRSCRLNTALNEAFLWHGTSQATASKIVQEGFDERVSSIGGMLGAGLYFAEDSCKSGQYAVKTIGRSRSHFFVLSRVLLGNPHYTDEPMPDIRRAPDACDSVVYTPSHERTDGHHREFVVYDRYQAYPEFVVEACTA